MHRSGVKLRQCFPRAGCVRAASTRIRCGEIANGRYRAPDPWYHLSKTVVVRRLSPNNRKIEADDDPAVLLSGEMLQLMGFDHACAHLGGANRAGAIKRDLERRKGAWLQEGTRRSHGGIGGGELRGLGQASIRPSRFSPFMKKGCPTGDRPQRLGQQDYRHGDHKAGRLAIFLAGARPKSDRGYVSFGGNSLDPTGASLWGSRVGCLKNFFKHQTRQHRPHPGQDQCS